MKFTILTGLLGTVALALTAAVTPAVGQPAPGEWYIEMKVTIPGEPDEHNKLEFVSKPSDLAGCEQELAIAAAQLATFAEYENHIHGGGTASTFTCKLELGPPV